MNFLNKKKELPQDLSSKEVLWYNPDPMVNRVGMIIRLKREIEVTQEVTLRNVLYEAIEVLIDSISEQSTAPTASLTSTTH
jgi:hypothetical protein